MSAVARQRMNCLAEAAVFGGCRAVKHGAAIPTSGQGPVVRRDRPRSQTEHPDG